MRLPFFLLMAALASAQEPPLFRGGVALVHVDAEVTAADGRVLDGFAKDDFKVMDEGKPRPVVLFAAGEEALDLILLFDVSRSMRPRVMEVAGAAQLGLRELREGDRVAIMVFNSKPWLITPFTEDLESVARAIRENVLSQQFTGSTLIQTAVDDAALRLMRQRRTQRRRAVLIITDNMGQRSRRESTVVRDFWEADTTLSALVVPNPAYQAMRTIGTIMTPEMLVTNVGVKGITAKTGGDFIHSEDAVGAFQEAMHRIRCRYSLYYRLPDAKPRSVRSIRVELTGEAARKYPKARVKARTGYLVPEHPPEGTAN
jgi:VWFA-related protein